MHFQPLVLLYVRGSFGYSCVLLKYMGAYGKTLEDLGTGRLGSQTHLVALQPYAFHTVKKKACVEGVIFLLYSKIILIL